MKTKKIAQYTALAAAAAAILPIASCSHGTNDTITPSTIFDTILTKSINMHGDSIDLNKDNKFDLRFYGEFGADYQATSIYSLNDSSNAILSDTTSFGGYSGVCINAPKASGTVINASSKFWKGSEAYLSYVYTPYSINKGIQGAGGKFLAFRLKLSDGFHFGWMKVSLSSDSQTLTLKEYAYEKTANKEIAVGAK